MIPASRPATGFRRPVLTVAIGSLLLLAQLAGAAHFALTTHEVCLEHGDFVHSARATVATVPLPARAALTQPVRESGVGAQDEHEHCAAQTFRRQGWTPPASPVSVSLQPAALVVAPRSLSVRWTGLALYRLAPKHSPPARG